MPPKKQKVGQNARYLPNEVVQEKVMPFVGMELMHFPQAARGNCGTFLRLLRQLPYFTLERLLTDAGTFNAFKQSVIRSINAFDKVYKQFRVLGTWSNAGRNQNRKYYQYVFGIKGQVSLHRLWQDTRRVQFGDDPRLLVDACKALVDMKRFLRTELLVCRRVLALVKRHQKDGDTKQFMWEVEERGLAPFNTFGSWHTSSPSLFHTQRELKILNISRLEKNLDHDDALLASTLPPNAEYEADRLLANFAHHPFLNPRWP